VNEYTTAVADNNIIFSASLQKENFFGVQFSLEKSGDPGIRVIRNFVELQAYE
jgi:glutamine amidotransferase